MRRRLIALLVAGVAPLVLWPWIARFPPGAIDDDGYFYAAIAYNAGVHGLFSFDGIHPTDGFHMLWGYVLAGGSFLLSWITPSRTAHFYLACAISIMPITFVADRYGHRLPDRILLFSLGIAGTLLLETPLLALLILTMVLRDPPAEASSAAQRAPYVLLAMAISATRIDATTVCVAWAACLLHDGRRRLASAVSIGVLLGVALQLLMNRYTAGAWISVAARIKADRAFADVWQRFLRVPFYPGRRILLVLLLCTSLLAMWRHTRTTGHRQWLYAWIAVGSFTVPHMFLLMRPWYFVPGFLGWTALLIKARDAGSPAAARAARAGLAAAWLWIAAFVVNEIVAGVRYAEDARAVERFVEDVRRIVPAGAPIFQVDGSGYVGFFSDRPVVNGDGLVNTHRYAERVRAGRLAGYLDEEGIDFIITNRAGMPQRVVNQGGLIVSRDELEEVARKRGPSVHEFTNFRLFRRIRARPLLP